MNIKKKKSSLIKALRKVDNKELLKSIEKMMQKKSSGKQNAKKSKKKAANHVIELALLAKMVETTA